MANLPITSRVLKSSSKGMKVRDPLLKVGTVAKQARKEDINLNDQGGQAEFEKQLKKQQNIVAGGNQTLNIDEAKNYGEVETDMDKYFKGLYERFGNDVTTQELVDKKYISKDAADAYNAFTGGANVGVKQPDRIEETETEVDVLTKITPNTMEKTGQSNFQSRQQGRKGLQLNRKLKRQKIKDARADAKLMFPDDKKKRKEYIRNAKLQAKKDQAAANRQNFQNMADDMATQTAQGSFGTNKFIDDQFLTDGQKKFNAQLKQNEDGSLRTETAQEIYERNNPKKKDFKSVFQNMATDLGKKDFSIKASQDKPQTFLGSGDDKPTFKDIISGIGDNLVGSKSIFAKKEGGTDVGNALRAINPFNKKDKPSAATTEVMSFSPSAGSLGSGVPDFKEGLGVPIMKRKKLKKNYFKK